MTKSVKWIVRTAAALALLIAVQAVTKAFGQVITGSCVNFLLAAYAGVLGVLSAGVVAIVSPFLAFLFGIGPKFLMVRVGIALGNLAFVVVVALFCAMLRKKLPRAHAFPAAVIAAVCKFLVMYFVVVKTIIPSLGIPEAAAATLSASMSGLQLLTAVIGGVVAALVIPLLRKAIKPLNSKPKE